ncbi:MAG: diacylglycerol kinase family lipid kinase [Verrucomicrobiota bacterium]|nr:diacylglycerol kinase family lipid kinase [Verrucomicrobiota bacterium]
MVVIFNPGSGANSGSADKMRASIRDAFAALGAEVEIVSPDESADLAALAKRGRDGKHETIIAAGGDGTISAVAGELVSTEKTFGVLPVGTLNHFAKDLKLPLEIEEAARTIRDGNVVLVDVGEVNGRVFLNNSSLGLYPQIVANREAQQDRLSRGKWSAAAWATLHAFRRFPFMNLRITVKGEQLARRTAFLFVGNNEYQISGFDLGGRERLDGGQLGLYLTHRTGRLGLFRLALHALFGRVNQAKDFEAFAVEEAVIETNQARPLVATDGEVNRMTSPLHYRIRARSLRVLVPRANAAVA